MLLTIAQPWLGMVFVTLSATTPLAGTTEATAGPHHHHPHNLNRTLALRVIQLLTAQKELAMEFVILNVIPMLVDKMVEIVGKQLHQQMDTSHHPQGIFHPQETGVTNG